MAPRRILESHLDFVHPFLTEVDFTIHFKGCLVVLTLAILFTYVSSRPDYSIQPGDDGPYQGDMNHGHGHHDHDHNHDHGQDENLEPPPPVPTEEEENPKDHKHKNCRLSREKTAIHNMCFLEPECKQECNKIPKKECTPYFVKECRIDNITACNTVQENVCQTTIVSQQVNECKPINDTKCETK